MCHANEPVRLCERTALHKTQGESDDENAGMKLMNEWSTDEPPRMVDMETALDLGQRRRVQNGVP